MCGLNANFFLNFITVGWGNNLSLFLLLSVYCECVYLNLKQTFFCFFFCFVLKLIKINWEENFIIKSSYIYLKRKLFIDFSFSFSLSLLLFISGACQILLNNKHTLCSDKYYNISIISINTRLLFIFITVQSRLLL